MPKMKMNPRHVAWCWNTFNSLPQNALWGVPASGLIFQRQGKDLVLMERQFPLEGFPIGTRGYITTEGKQVSNAVLLKKFQTEELKKARRHFAAAGITITGEISEDIFTFDNSIIDVCAQWGLTIKLSKLPPPPEDMPALRPGSVFRYLN